MTKAIATREPETNSLALISAAHRALAEAVTLGDFRAIRDTAETLRAGARARDMGIENENLAAEIVVRAERAMGAELGRMAEAGERHLGPGETRNQYMERPEDSPPTLAELGIARHHSQEWQKLARLTDEQFNEIVERAKQPRTDGTVRRIARVEFFEEVERLYPAEGPARSRVVRPRHTGTTPEVEVVMAPGPLWDRDTARFESDEAAMPADLDGGDAQVSRYAWQTWDRIVSNADALQTLLDHGWEADGRPAPALHAEVNAVGRLLLVMQRLAGPVA